LKLTPEHAVEDLGNYLHSFDSRLSHAAKRVFQEVEVISQLNDNPPLPTVFLLCLIKTVPQLRQAIVHYGGDPNLAISLLSDDIRESRDNRDHYETESTPYSSQEHREFSSRARVIDLCLAIARRNFRKEVFDLDVIEAFLEHHEEEFPVWNNSEWTDKRLHTSFNTLSHVLGRYSEVLWVKFDDLREQLNLLPLSLLKNTPIESAPPSIRSSVLHLLQDYPDYEKNCFLVMSFTSTRLHNEIYKVLRQVLSRFGLNLLRADDRSYTDDLFTNVETYLYGCSFAIAVFERLISEVYNPNVSFEVGFLLGMGKPVCLLKEKTVPKLPSDLVGKLYRDFDAQDIRGTLPRQIEQWLRDKKII
jgi:hypothetical protein